MKANTQVIFFTAIVTLLLLSACQSSTQQDTIEIGSILILTGDGASWGIAARNGMDMAAEKINQEGGILGKKLILVHEDDGSDPKRALSAFQKLTDINHINLIVGTTWSHTGLPLVQRADEKKVIMVSPSLGVKEFNEGSKYLFNIWPHDYLLSEELAKQVYGKGHRKVAIFSAQQVWVKDQTDAFRKEFEKLGGKIQLVVEPDPDDKELRAEALKISAHKDIDAIINPHIQAADIIAKRLKEAGVKVPIYSVALDNAIIQASQGAMDGTIFLTSLTPSLDFEKAYKEKYDMELDIGADTGYDAVMLLAQAIKAVGSTDSNKIADYLGSLKEYDGASGHLTFDGKRGVTKPFVAKQVMKGVAMTID
ncbi:MAG TPA: ABC transporter substrate-binding protein [Candidatus Nanoarchaeia archaeon]|nr:ABC transporter substrate-binding protein [Candidatus Nanoarchaeia archaeon]